MIQQHGMYTTTWNVIDFIDIPMSLASRLTDDDIGAVLICIDALKKLKRINLPTAFMLLAMDWSHCDSSAVLEELDLGL